MGSVLSWFSPATPTTPQGRTFNLSLGKVEDTETTYKYKMQVLGDEAGEGSGMVEGEGSDPGHAQPTSCDGSTSEPPNLPPADNPSDENMEPPAEAPPPSDPAPTEEEGPSASEAKVEGQSEEDDTNQ